MKLEANEEFTVSLSSHKSCFAEFDPVCSSVMSNVGAAFRFGDFPLATMIPFSSLFTSKSPLDFRMFHHKFQSPAPQLSTDIRCSNSLFRRRPLVYFQTRRICERKIWPNFLCSQHPKLAKRCLIHRTRFDELSLLRPRMNCTKIMQAFANRKRIKLFDTRIISFSSLPLRGKCSVNQFLTVESCTKLRAQANIVVDANSKSNDTPSTTRIG